MGISVQSAFADKLGCLRNVYTLLREYESACMMGGQLKSECTNWNTMDRIRT